MFNNKTIAALSVLTAVLFSTTTSATAGGFSSKKHHGGASMAKAYSKSYANLKTRKARLKINNHASINFKSLYGGKIIKANAQAGNNIYLKVNGKRCYSKCGAHTYLKSYSAAKTKIYAKGKRVLAKAQAINYVKLRAKGKVIFDYESESYAIGNFTPLGVHVNAATFSKLNLAAKGYTLLQNGNLARTSLSIR